MQGLLTGAVFGIGTLACLSAARSWRHRRNLSPGAGASRAVLAASAALQLIIGLLCFVLGAWMLVAAFNV